MMRELVALGVGRRNAYLNDKNNYNSGISLAYFLVLSLLHMQAKVFHIPLNYLSLHTIDHEAAAESAEYEFYAAIVEGCKEIFALMKRYGIDILNFKN